MRCPLPCPHSVAALHAMRLASRRAIRPCHSLSLRVAAVLCVQHRLPRCGCFAEPPHSLLTCHTIAPAALCSACGAPPTPSNLCCRGATGTVVIRNGSEAGPIVWQLCGATAPVSTPPVFQLPATGVSGERKITPPPAPLTPRTPLAPSQCFIASVQLARHVLSLLSFDSPVHFVCHVLRFLSVYET